jgi:hypothetical protein
MSTNTNETIQSDTGSEDARVGVRETASAGREMSDDRSAEVSSSSSSSSSAQRVVPVAEAKKYRKRAQSAEQSLEDVQRELQAKSQRVMELEETIAELERRSAIDQLLIEAEAIDLEAARLLTESAVRQMDESDVAEAVAELKRAKPFLFRQRKPSASNMSARIDGANGAHAASDAIEHAAAEAHATGDRTDLLRYLRLRRKQK